MRLLYQISLFLYSTGIRIYGLFNSKAKSWYQGRQSTLWDKLPTNGKSVIWFHCASLGEFDIGLPLMEKWKKENPDDFLFVTFFSPSGMENYHKRNHPADAVDFLPLDTPKNAKKFISAVQPKTVFFVKYEFWAFHLFEAKKIGAKIYSVNTIFRENQIYFKGYGEFYREILHCFDHFFVQNEKSIQLLETISIKNASISGDLRFDRVFENKKNVQPNPIFEKWLNNEKAFIIGSSWPKDEEVLMHLINSDAFDKKVIIAPHEIEKNHVVEIEKQIKKKHIRYTELETDLEKLKDVQVIILNTIGHLTNTFQYGDIAYIGGGFSGKLHNILEPAVYGLPVFFGPKHNRFPEADLFIEKGFGFEIENVKDFDSKWNDAMSKQKNIQKLMLNFMENQVGVSESILTSIKKIK